MTQKSTQSQTSSPTAEAIIAGVAKGIWKKAGNEGEPPIPKPDDLKEFWDAEHCHEMRGVFTVKSPGVVNAEAFAWRLRTNNEILKIVTRVSGIVRDIEDSKWKHFVEIRVIFKEEPAIELLHGTWGKLREIDPKVEHPLAPAVRAWLLPTWQIEKRPKQIVPSFLKESQITIGDQLPTGTLHTQGGTTTTQLQLPSLDNDDDDVVVHALPIEIYKGGQGTRGAPLDERIFFNALLARPFGKKEDWNAVRLEPTLRDYVDWLYPNGWNRTNQLPLLRKALYDVHNKRISYERRDWNIVQVLAMPNASTKLEDVLPLIVRYPDGVQGNGPMIDIHRMRQYGLVSASKWRAWIRLHYLWDTAKQRNGGYPIYASIPKVKKNDEGYLLDAKDNIIMTGDPYKNKKGRWSVRKGSKPQRAWYHPYAIRTGNDRNPQCDKIPVLTDNQLVALFFDDKRVDNNTLRKRRHDAKTDLMDFEADGVVIVERDAIDIKRGVKGWRIIPVFQDKNTLPDLYNR